MLRFNEVLEPRGCKVRIHLDVNVAGVSRMDRPRSG